MRDLSTSPKSLLDRYALEDALRRVGVKNVVMTRKKVTHLHLKKLIDNKQSLRLLCP